MRSTAMYMWRLMICCSVFIATFANGEENTKTGNKVEGVRPIPRALWQPDIEFLVKDKAIECLPLDRILSIPGGLEGNSFVLVHRNGDQLEILSKCSSLQAPPSMIFSSSDAKIINGLNTSGNGTGSGKGFKDIPAKVWIASVIAIVIISAVGLLGVAIVPLMQRVFYNHIIQFLVALAVGSLTGDAMLHLLPHAIAASGGEHGSHDEGEEKQAIFKGLVALGGLYFFFIAEKLVAIISEYRAEKKAEEEERKKAARASRKPSTLTDWKFVEEQRRRSLRCEGAVTVGLSSHAMKSIDTIQRYRESEDTSDRCMEDANSEDGAIETSRLTRRVDRQPYRAEYQPENGATAQDPNRLSVRIVVPEMIEENEINNDKQKVTPLDGVDGKTESQHGHGHSHNHEVPDSIASVAWMVILGDGLHNFTDGLAIGAAFAKGFTGGFSTSVAVFCHELPHELGDFAVLLATGMSVKQALFYNILSSVLCLIGMFIGIALGNVESASFWIFAITAGIFIYIALVDMLPELSSINAKAGESRLAHFLIQSCGIMTGVGIMFLIAMFEENIKAAFG